MRQLAVRVPVIALVLAAANVRDGVDEAAVDKRQPRRRERGGDGDAVGAVAVEEHRRRAVERRVAAIEDRHRHGLAIGGGRIEPARHVVGRVVSARHLLALAQRACARLHIVVVGLGRRRHRRVDETGGRRVELVAGRDAKRIRLFREGDEVLGAVGEAAHDDARQSVLALQPHHVLAVEDGIEHQASRAGAE